MVQVISSTIIVFHVFPSNLSDKNLMFDSTNTNKIIVQKSKNGRILITNIENKHPTPPFVALIKGAIIKPITIENFTSLPVLKYKLTIIAVNLTWVNITLLGDIKTNTWTLNDIGKSIVTVSYYNYIIVNILSVKSVLAVKPFIFPIAMIRSSKGQGIEVKPGDWDIYDFSYNKENQTTKIWTIQESYCNHIFWTEYDYEPFYVLDINEKTCFLFFAYSNLSTSLRSQNKRIMHWKITNREMVYIEKFLEFDLQTKKESLKLCFEVNILKKGIVLLYVYIPMASLSCPVVSKSIRLILGCSPEIQKKTLTLQSIQIFQPGVKNPWIALVPESHDLKVRFL
ncbi:unnamed protein product [Gordionus sp. m RMFG-2023]